jgi:hypothetical protein
VTETTDSNGNRAFLRDGYAVVPGALPQALLESLREMSNQRLDQEAAEHFEIFKFHGSMLQLDPFEDETTRHLVTNPRTLTALDDFGFPEPKWLSAYLISKPSGGPSLWWHQDWWAWDQDCSFSKSPPQVFVMYYLRDVDERNGALRVIPGSHRCPHPLHRRLPSAHSQEMNQAAESGVAQEHQPDEITVQAKAGDAVIGDVRLLHATHPNLGVNRRTCLTLWYLPTYGQLPDAIKSYVVEHPAQPPRGWWSESSREIPQCLRSLLPTYDGAALPATYNREPPSHWPDVRSTT